MLKKSELSWLGGLLVVGLFFLSFFLLFVCFFFSFRVRDALLVELVDPSVVEREHVFSSSRLLGLVVRAVVLNRGGEGRRRDGQGLGDGRHGGRGPGEGRVLQEQKAFHRVRDLRSSRGGAEDGAAGGGAEGLGVEVLALATWDGDAVGEIHCVGECLVFRCHR